MKNKLHYFANYEYERKPLTSIWNTPYPAFNVDADRHREREAGGRPPGLPAVVEDARRWARCRTTRICSSRSARAAPRPRRRAPTATSEHTTDVLGQLTQVLSNRAVNEIKAGYSVATASTSITARRRWSQALAGVERHHQPTSEHHASPASRSTGNDNAAAVPQPERLHVPRRLHRLVLRARRGRHDLKAGGEYLHLLGRAPATATECGGRDHRERRARAGQHRRCRSRTSSTRDTWNLAAISIRITRAITSRRLGLVGVPARRSACGSTAPGRRTTGRSSSKLTLNLGLRYDLI